MVSSAGGKLLTVCVRINVPNIEVACMPRRMTR